MTNRDWLTSLTDEELANELLNFAGLRKKLTFGAFLSFDAVTKWLGEEHTDESAVFDDFGNYEVILSGQDDSQWSKELTRGSWYPGKYNGGGWPPR